MATAFNLVDYRTVEPVRRARLRVVEAAPVPAAAAVAAPAAKLMPPAWMVAPPFPVEPVMCVDQRQAQYHAVPAAADGRPYRNIREVPRAGW